jgi:hypothetical protein
MGVSKKGTDMYNTCDTGCCSSNVPIRDSSHAKCHCGDTHWCESPVITKRISNCSDGCCTSSTTSIQNTDEVMQYVDGLRDEHCGHSEHDLCRTIEDISKGSSTCCTPTPPPVCGCSTGCSDDYCGCNDPALHYEDLNCSTSNNVTCCSSTNQDRAYIARLANRLRGRLNHRCHTYGNIKPTIKEIPAANVFLVNHVFIDLLIDHILGCLPTRNMSKEVVDKVCYYTEQYYIYYKDIELVGSLVIGDTVKLDKNLIADPTVVGRTKAVLYALSDRLKGRINANEQ